MKSMRQGNDQLPLSDEHRDPAGEVASPMCLSAQRVPMVAAVLAEHKYLS